MFLDPDNNKSYIKKSGSAFRITQTIEALESSGAANKTVIVPLKKSLPDKDDDSFLEVAFTGKIDVIITENKKHFPKEICKNINVLSPSEFLNNYHLSLYQLFDFGDEWRSDIKLLKIDKELYLPIKPVIIESEGKSPEQYPVEVEY